MAPHRLVDVLLDQLVDFRQEVPRVLVWVPGNKVKFELTLADGRKKEIVEEISALQHEENRTHEYRIFGLDIRVDPTISIGSVTFSDEHVGAADPTEETPENQPAEDLTPRRLSGPS